jgi:serine/threonine protein kinase
MTHLAIYLIGPFQATLDGKRITGFDSDKVRALLSYLALESERPQRREKLAGLLWPEFAERSARTNLRSALSNLRKLINDQGASTPYLHITRQTIQFNTDSDCEIDVSTFSQLVEGVRGQPPTIQQLEDAVVLYRGSFLEGFSIPDSVIFEEWALVTREKLQGQALRGMHRLAEYYESLGSYEAALRFAQQQVELDSFREEAYQQVMRILDLSNQRNEALAQFETYRRILAEEFGAEPSEAITLLYSRILAGELQRDPSDLRKRSIRGYELRELLGTGGFGAVYRAYQPAVGREVAIKIILPKYANQPNFIHRFEVEAQLVARLEHPHITPLYDYWREHNGAYLVMRWMKAGSLQDKLSHGPWNLESSVELLDQICSALSLAHRHGVVHRDIRPANILLDEESHAYLSDFGIATLTDTVSLPGLSDITLSDSPFSGSPEFISPEQIRHQPVTPQSDIYSLGVVLFLLLTGQHPFQETPQDELPEKHLSEPLPLVHKIRPEIPKIVDEIIQFATAKEPDDRFPNASELATAFRDVVRGGSSRMKTQVRGSTAEQVNPYKGLRPFLEVDAEDFFGRQALIERLSNHLFEPSSLVEKRLLAVVGPSGSGKSSVVKAGLVPALRRGAIPGSEKWFITEMIPGTDPFEELEAALLRIAVNPPVSMLEQLKDDERGLLRAVLRALPDGDSQLLLVIDQFEELFTLTKVKDEREQFLKGILNAVSDPGSRLRVVLTLRADFYDKPLQYIEFGELIRQNTEVVLPLSEEELVEAITRPSENAGVDLEPGLVSTIIADLKEQPGALPLLQFALTELFEQREGNQLTLNIYEAIGGVVGALGCRAEELYTGLDDVGREAIRQLFLRLVIPGEGGEDTRRRVLRSELSTLKSTKYNLSGEILNEALEQFGRFRLLTFDRDPATRAPTVEIAHEAILIVWERLGEWISYNRDQLHQHRRLMLAVAEWIDSGRDSSYLLQGARLDAYDGWAIETDLALTPVEGEFLHASLEERLHKQQIEEERHARERKLERRTRILRTALLIALGVVLVGTLIVCVLTPKFISNLFTPPVSPQQAAAWDQGRGVAFDPQSGVLAVSGTDNSPTVRDPLTGEVLMVLVGHSDRVLNIDYSGDGRCIATTSLDGTVKVWDPHTGDAILSVDGGDGELVSPALNSDCTRLAFSNVPGVVQIWDISTGTYLDTFYPGGGTLGLDFSPDDNLLAVATSYNSVDVLEISSGDTLFVLTGHEETVSDVVFSSSGKWLATSSFDGTARIWDASSGDLFVTLRDNDVQKIGIDFDLDGSRVATCGSDGVVKVWEVETGRELLSLTGHGGWVLNVAFSPDNNLLASGSDDNETIVWQIAP